MAQNTKIEWADHTFNPWMGCTKVSPACAHCYAETLMDTRYGRVKWGAGEARVRTSAENWNLPLRWDTAAARHKHVRCVKCGFVEAWNEQAVCKKCGGRIIVPRPRVFCASLADWLDEEVEIEWLVDLLLLIAQTPNLVWMLLSKRPENWRTRIDEAAAWCYRTKHPQEGEWILQWLGGNAPENVWVGVTVENQGCAEERLPELIRIPARGRFASCEPLLGPLELRPWLGLTSFAAVRSEEQMEAALRDDVFGNPEAWAMHWIIAGGESGSGARVSHPIWFQALRDQCAEYGVAFHFKQWGVHDERGKPVGKVKSGRLLDGREWNQVPLI